MERPARDLAAPRAMGPLAAGLGAFPAEVLVLIFALVPADVRPQLALVCSAFRAALRSPALWARLDLSAAAGIRREITDARLRAFAARFAERAGGRLQALDVSGCRGLTRDALAAVVGANPGVELTLCHPRPGTLSQTAFAALLEAAGPRLGGLVLSADCSTVAEALAVLRREGPFAVVRAVRRLGVSFPVHAPQPSVDELRVLLDAADGSAGGAPQLELKFADLRGEGVLDALVDRVLALRMRYLSLLNCKLPLDGGAAMERLLRDGTSLSELHLQDSKPLFDEAHAACPLARGLAANGSLRALSLRGCSIWDLHGDCDRPRCMDSTLALLAALAAHPSLRWLDLSHNLMWIIPRRDAETRALDNAVGAVLAAMLRAPALLELDLGHSMLRADVLEPLFAALRGRTTLQVLRCVESHRIEPLTERLVKDVLTPAVALNEGLRDLFLGSGAEFVEVEVVKREARRRAAGDREEERRLLREAAVWFRKRD